MTINFYYITVATKPHPVLENIEKKIKNNNEDINVLGLHENREIGWQGTGNFGIKLREVKNFLFKPEIKPQDVVLFTDAYDVIYCGSHKEIMKRYLSIGKSILFGCETQCHPDKNAEIKYKKKDVEFPYLNSGMFIGQAWALRHCLINYQYNDGHDDQRFWTEQYFKYPLLFGLDYDNQIVLNTEGIEWEKLKWEDNKANYKGKNPQFIHVNGPDKSKINSLYKKLN